MEDEQTTPETQAPAPEAKETETAPQGGTSLSDVEALQAELNRARAEAAKYRTERNELKTDAEKWAEFQESQKSEVEKTNERNAALEQQITQLTAEKQRSEVALKYGLTADDYDLLGAGDEATLAARAEKIAELRKAAAAAVTPPPSNTPTESLRGGGGSVDEPEDDAYPSHW